jgi:TPR repeat protein
MFAAMGLAAALVVTPAGASSTQEAAQAVKQQDGADIYELREAGTLAYVRGDFLEAIRLWRMAADEGDAKAQINLGFAYASGLVGPPDDVEAVRWFRIAADQGEAVAQGALGVMYENGEGVPQNSAEAVRWYRLAADQYSSEGQFALGTMYYRGLGVPQSHSEAVRWYRLAADQGNFKGQFELGHMYEAGEGVPQDYVQAYKWFSLAAVQDVSAAVERRDDMIALMTPAQIAEGQRLAAEWRPRSPQ